MLITRPSIFLYVPKDQCQNVIKNGISLSNKTVSAYLKRLPENNETYAEFLSNNYPVQITYTKIKRIKDQDVKLTAVNIDGVGPDDKIDDDVLTKLKKKYDSYLGICYNDHVPLEDIPHIDITFSKSFIPGFACKVLKNNSFELANK